MNDPRLNTVAALTLKFRLEAALQSFQQEESLAPLLDNTSPDFETNCIRNIQLAQRKMHNGVLIELYGLGIWIHERKNPYQANKFHHRVGSFIYKYFKDSPGAIWHLEEVNPTMIDKVGPKTLRALLNTKKGWGPTFSTPGNMWQAAANLVDSPRYSPKPVPPPTPPRTSFLQEIQELEQFFNQEPPNTEETLLLCAPFSPELSTPSPRPLKRSRIST